MTLKAKTFKSGKEFASYIERVTGKPFKTMPSTEGTTAHEYLSGRRDRANLFTDSDLIAILDDKHPEEGLLYVFSDYSSVVFKPSNTNRVHRFAFEESMKLKPGDTVRVVGERGNRQDSRILTGMHGALLEKQIGGFRRC